MVHSVLEKALDELWYYKNHLATIDPSPEIIKEFKIALTSIVNVSVSSSQSFLQVNRA